MYKIIFNDKRLKKLNKKELVKIILENNKKNNTTFKEKIKSSYLI